MEAATKRLNVSLTVVHFRKIVCLLKYLAGKPEKQKHVFNDTIVSKSFRNWGKSDERMHPSLSGL